MYNVKTRRVRATIFAVTKREVLRIISVCVCSFSYPACGILSSVVHPATQYFPRIS
jgi:hypothetical protein